MICIVILGFAGPGCREQSEIAIDRNIAPETILTGAPGDSMTSFYRVHMFWSGFDADGEILGYEWAITDSIPEIDLIDYKFTTRTDSLFRFRVEENSEVLGHRFYVRAIDDDGRRDPTPAFTFFAARNVCAPEVDFIVAEGVSPDGTERIEITSTDQGVPTDTIPTGWSVCFTWRGFDCDVALDPQGNEVKVGSIARYFYKLTPRELSDQGGTLADTSICYDAQFLRSGPYVFLARGIDDAGFAGLDPEARSFVWNRDPVCRWTNHLPDGAADSVAAFFADITGSGLADEDFIAFGDGDTLPIVPSGSGVRIFGQVRGYDPDAIDGIGTVAEYQARLVDDTGRWQTLGANRTFRDSSLFTDRQGYKLMCRARDRLDRWSEPQILNFYINFAPRFLTEAEFLGQPFVQSPLPGEVLEVAPGDTTLTLRFAASDPDRSSPAAQRLEWQYKFDRYPPAAGGTGAETFFSGWAQGDLLGRFRTISRLETPVALQSRGAFVPGDYILTMQVREFRSDAESALGKRIGRRRVSFRIEAP